MSSEVSLEKTFPPLPETQRGVPFLLRSDPKGEKLIYAVANTVVIRDLKEPTKSELITHHNKKVTAVAYSPSGFYVASGDAGGTIKFWDTVNPEHLVVKEYQPLSGAIRDISWSEDNTRICVVGEGRNKMAHAFMFDSGNSVGSLSGHIKTALSCDFRKARPFSVVTGGEDHILLYFKGTPLKFEQRLENHRAFVNCIRFSPDSSLLATAGQDGKIFIFNGTNMELERELKGEDMERAHNGGVYGISWSPDGKQLLSSSGDKTCKVWDVLTGSCKSVINMGSDMLDQQLGCVWAKNFIISVSLSGKLTFLDESNFNNLEKSLWGHNKGIICMVAAQNKIITGSFEGMMNIVDYEVGLFEKMNGTGFSNQVTSMSVCQDLIGACGVQDFVKFASLSQKSFISVGNIGMPSQPQKIAVLSEKYAVVGCLHHVVLIIDHSKKVVIDTSFSALAVAGYKNKSGELLVVVGGSDKKLRFYKIEGEKLTENAKPHIELQAPASDIKFSSDGKYMGVGTVLKLVYVFDAESHEELQSWSGHANKVNIVNWSPDNIHLATCGTDGDINIWRPSDRNFRINHRNAHRTYNVSAVDWIDKSTIITVGQQDCSMKSWKITALS